jgi:hypothetical protein
MPSCFNWQMLCHCQLLLQSWHHHFSQLLYIVLKLGLWPELQSEWFPEMYPQKRFHHLIYFSWLHFIPL